jgi:hypothetical protein
MNYEKLICTYCKSDKIEYVPAPFQGQSTWFDVRYEQQKNGKFKAVIRGDNGKDNSANVSNIKRNVINYNDSRPWFNCNSCTAELDGYDDVEYKSIDGGDDE